MLKQINVEAEYNIGAENNIGKEKLLEQTNFFGK